MEAKLSLRASLCPRAFDSVEMFGREAEHPWVCLPFVDDSQAISNLSVMRVQEARAVFR